MKKELQLAVLLGAVCANLARAATLYVSPAGTNDAANRYNTWEGAAQSINAAVAIAAANDEVVVTNGAYPVSTNLYVTNFTVRSVNGPAVTTVYPPTSGTFPIFRLAHTGACVSGFTMTNGWWNGGAGSVSMSAGTVSNCWMVNSPYRGGSGGSIEISGGLMSSCLISNSQPRSYALYLSGGTIEDSTICDNVELWDNGPVRVLGGTMRRCKVLRNRSDSGSDGGGGVTLSSGLIENSLIAGNYTPQNGKPGGVRQSGGTMVNCTIAANSNLTGATVGSGVYRTGGTLTNCIVYGNTGAGGTNFSGATSAAWYSCAPELTNSAQGNITNNPQFISLATGDCHLRRGSPAMDTGTTLSAVTNDLDLAVRPQDGDSAGGAVSDMGCYEVRDPTTGPLTASFTGTPLSGFIPMQVVFTSSFEGVNTDIAWYGWDFDNDGAMDQSGANLGVVTHNYTTPGVYTVSLRAANSIGETAGATNPAYVAAVKQYIYVATNGSHDIGNQFDTWSGAATNINTALAIATDRQTVLVSNGVYAVTTQLTVNAFTVRSVNGPAVTTVYRPDSAGTLFPIFRVNHSGALVSGLAITNGFWSLNGDCGGSVHLTGGTVSNCWIVNTRYIGGTQSGAIYMNGGLITACLLSNSVPRSFALKMIDGVVEDCTIANNTDPYDESPVRVAGGTMRRCRVTGNRAQGGTAAGPVWLGGGLIENSLLYGNVGYNNAAGAVSMGGGRLVNCTIASNKNASATVGSGVGRSGGTLTNCIVYGNSGSSNNYSGSLSAAAYSCAPELTSGTGNITNNPLFVNLAAGDCHLQKLSPCINKGYTDDAMRSGVDLDGLPRVKQSVVDMGAYELPPPLGTLLELR